MTADSASSSMDPVDTSSLIDPEMVASALPVLNWARVLLITKQHGLVGLLTIAMIYQVGLLAKAQNVMCGI